MDIRRTAGWVLVVVAGLFATAAAGSIILAATLSASPRENLPALMMLVNPYSTGFFAVVFLLVGWRMARQRPDIELLRARPVPPVEVPDAADVSDLPAPISACPDCGFLGIRMPQIEDALWPGGGELGDRKVCPRCGFQGLAVSFDSGDEYATFVRGLAVD